MAKKLPKVVYGRIERSNNGEEDFWAWETAEQAIDGDGPTEIGEYQLVRVTKMKKVVQKA